MIKCYSDNHLCLSGRTLFPLQHCYHLSELKLRSSCSLCHFCQHGDVIISQKFITCSSWWESHDHLLVWTELTRYRHLLCLLLILIPCADIYKFCLIGAVDKRSLQLPLCSYCQSIWRAQCRHGGMNLFTFHILWHYHWMVSLVIRLRFQQCNRNMQLI